MNCKVVEINCRFTSTYIGLKNAYGDKAIKISCDGGAATGKSTGARMIAKKYNLKF